MKKIFYRNLIRILLPALLILGGCDKYLEENPDNRVELDTPEKAAQLLTNAYCDGSYTFTEWMTDEVNYTYSTQKLPEHEQAYLWEDFTGSDQDTPSSFWGETYEAIAHANEVLKVIDQMEGDQKAKDAVKGEALLARAYGHFMLVNLFAEHYDEDDAEDDLGIPYVTEPEEEFIKSYKRHTVQEVYDFIENDLLDGLELVDNSFYANSGKYHFTREAALAFASRFYLFKGDLADCIKYSTELLGTDPDNFVKDLPTIQRERINIEDYIRLYHAPTDPSNLLLMRQVSNFHLPSLGHWPSSDTYGNLYGSNPFGETDLRENPAWQAGSNGIAATKYEFLFERSSLTSNVGFNYTIFLGFRGEEVLLNRAECYVLQNKINLAVADLQVLSSKRFEEPVTLTIQVLRNYYGSSQDQEITLDYILTERMKEFMHEGIRWFDIRRYQIPVEHELPDGSTVKLKAKDKRKVIQIPQSAIDVGGLEPNPRD
jgi:starch-binding outer membrane protein, SusD/RagB family